jgi:hypothetical protein
MPTINRKMLSSTFFDADGRPSFNALQNFASAETPIVYYVFDLFVLAGREVREETLATRGELLEQRVLPKLTEPVQYLQELDASLRDLVASVKVQGHARVRVLRRRPADLRGQNAQRRHAGAAGAADEEIPRPETKECPFGNLPETKSGRGEQD